MAKKAPKVEKEDLMLPQSIDIKENYLLTEYPEALDLLLIDQTTHKNIFWASKSYEQLGDGYKFFDSITREKITGENGNVIKPRAAKSKEEQTMRVKVNAEVFTPSWICNKQNNLVDQSWFGRKDVFNKEDGTTWHPTEGKIRFPNKTGKFHWKSNQAHILLLRRACAGTGTGYDSYVRTARAICAYLFSGLPEPPMG